MQPGERGWLWRALVGMIGAAVVLIVGSRVNLPGLDEYSLRLLESSYEWMPSATLSIFALGIQPAISGFLLVELIAVLVPRFRARRHEKKFRARLNRAARIVAVLLAGFQAWSVATYAESAELLTGSPWTVAVTLTAGACVLLLVAEAITRQGLVNGFVWLFVLHSLLRGPRLGGGLTGDLSTTAVWSLRLVGVASVFALTVLFAGALVSIAPNRLRGAIADPYRLPPRQLPIALGVPVPPSGLLPLYSALPLLALPTSLVLAGVPVEALQAANNPPFRVAVAILLAVALGYLFSPIKRAARVLGAARVTEDGVRSVSHRAVVVGAAFVGALALVNEAFSSLAFPISALVLALSAALAVDAIRMIRACRALGPLVSIQQERRSYAWASAAHALGEQGLSVHPAGTATSTLLNFVGPYAPVEILVPARDRKKASHVLRDSSSESPVAPDTSADRKETREVAGFARSQWVALAVLVSVSALLAFAPEWLRRQVHAMPVELAVFAVDDQAAQGLRGQTQFPEGAELHQERLKEGTTWYVSFAKSDAESLDATLARARAWAKDVRLPEGTRLVWEPETETDPETLQETTRGYRSFVIAGEPIVSQANLVDAIADYTDRANPAVNVHFDHAGAVAFEDATERLVDKRLAILVDGVVMSAPIVLSRIAGGHVRITLGLSAAPNEAKNLAASLRAAAALRAKRR